MGSASSNRRWPAITAATANLSAIRRVEAPRSRHTTNSLVRAYPSRGGRRGGALQVRSPTPVGHNNNDTAAARERSIIVTNTPDVLNESTADLTWSLILGV